MKAILLSRSLNFLFRLTNKYQIPYFAVKCLNPRKTWNTSGRV